MINAKEHLDVLKKKKIEELRQQYQYFPNESYKLDAEAIKSYNHSFTLPSTLNVSSKKIWDYIEKTVPTLNFHFMLQGEVGCGKTTIAKLIYEYVKRFQTLMINRLEQDKHIFNSAFYDVEECYQDYLDSRHEKSIKNSFKTNTMFFCLDDVGDEKPKTDASKIFVSSLIHKNYKHFINQSRIKEKNRIGNFVPRYNCSIITTNLTSDLIKKEYGVRTLDRIREQYTIIKFKNKSYRAKMTKTIE